MRRVDSLEKTLMLGGIGGRRKRGWQRMRWLDGIIDSMDMSLWVWVNSGSWWWTGRPGMLWFTGSQRVGHEWATELNWTDALLTTSKIPFLRSQQTIIQQSDLVFIWSRENSQLSYAFQSVCLCLIDTKPAKGCLPTGLFSTQNIILVLSNCYLQIAGQQDALPLFWASVHFLIPLPQSLLLALLQEQLLP